MLILLVGAGLVSLIYVYGTKPKIPGHGLIRSGPPVLVCRSNWFHVTLSRKSLTGSPFPLRRWKSGHNSLTIFVLKAIILLYESGANSIMASWISIAYHYALSRRGNKSKSNDGTRKVLLEDSSSLPRNEIWRSVKSKRKRKESSSCTRNAKESWKNRHFSKNGPSLYVIANQKSNNK